MKKLKFMKQVLIILEFSVYKEIDSVIMIKINFPRMIKYIYMRIYAQFS
jgi:hypothetical protein